MIFNKKNVIKIESKNTKKLHNQLTTVLSKNRCQIQTISIGSLKYNI
jgi:hypothetical protein